MRKNFTKVTALVLTGIMTVSADLGFAAAAEIEPEDVLDEIFIDTEEADEDVTVEAEIDDLAALEYVIDDAEIEETGILEDAFDAVEIEEFEFLEEAFDEAELEEIIAVEEADEEVIIDEADAEEIFAAEEAVEEAAIDEADAEEIFAAEEVVEESAIDEADVEEEIDEAIAADDMDSDEEFIEIDDYDTPLGLGYTQEEMEAAAKAQMEAMAAQMKVTISCSRESSTRPGDTICLTSEVEGFDSCSGIAYQWMCDKGNGYEPVNGANGAEYSFTADEENMGWGWRLMVYYC